MIQKQQGKRSHKENDGPNPDFSLMVASPALVYYTCAILSTMIVVIPI
jgi:hypothetical protein